MSLMSDGHSRKTSQDGSRPQTTRSDASWELLWERIPHSQHLNADGGVVRVLSMDRVDAQRGASSMRKDSSRNAGGAFSWCMHGMALGEIPLECFTKPKPTVNSILQKDGVPDRFFLPQRACAGIHARAIRRGKELPFLIATALRAVAEGWTFAGHENTCEPSLYRFHALGSTAMTGDGHAKAAARVDVARCVDTCGGFAAHQGGNLVLSGVDAETHGEIGHALSDDTLVFDVNQVTSALNYSNPKVGGPVHPLTHSGQPPYLVVMSDLSEGTCGALDGAIYQESQYGIERYDTAGTLRAGRVPAHQQVVTRGAEGAPVRTLRVRRLTPLECLRLQGFADDHFDGVACRGKPLGDGASYRMTGNSWAVPVVSWVFSRLQAEDDICDDAVDLAGDGVSL